MDVSDTVLDAEDDDAGVGDLYRSGQDPGFNRGTCT